MKQLENLRQTAERGLAGLEATPQLRGRIVTAAMEGRKARPMRAWKPMAAFAVAAAVLALVILPPVLRSRNADIPVIVEQAAGTEGIREGEAALLSHGQVQVTSAGAAGESSVWAPAAGGSFPLVGINGRYYRLMTYALPINAERGAKLGTVETVTDEPLYASGVVSNQLPVGTDVYAVSGMDGAAITADANGTRQVYQRVSLNQMGLASGEKLDATLCAAGKIASMTLSDVGTVTDPEACARLYSALTDGASLEGTGPFSGQQTLHITLTNGMVLEMAVRGDRVSACGVWSCPGFSEAFAAEVQ